MDPAFSDSRTKSSYFGFPGLGIHNFGPERPCTALVRAGFVNRAAFFFEKHAIGIFFVFAKMPDAVGLIAISFLKGGHRYAKVFGETLAVFDSEENEAEFAVGCATFAGALALEAQALLIKWFFCVFWH